MANSKWATKEGKEKKNEILNYAEGKTSTEIRAKYKEFQTKQGQRSLANLLTSNDYRLNEDGRWYWGSKDDDPVVDLNELNTEAANDAPVEAIKPAEPMKVERIITPPQMMDYLMKVAQMDNVQLEDLSVTYDPKRNAWDFGITGSLKL